ncbi:hypothetical protein [Acidilobus sp.]|uniref:hypothetical protein n=1 Tax=Acidilobus sp. TaxID=1872109 RepID=UPI003CFDF6E4
MARNEASTRFLMSRVTCLSSTLAPSLASRTLSSSSLSKRSLGFLLRPGVEQQGTSPVTGHLPS